MKEEAPLQKLKRLVKESESARKHPFGFKTKKHEVAKKMRVKHEMSKKVK